MNVDSENLIPARRPSGRLSKPSMELLVDNQRLLSHYVEPKKRRKVEIEKFVEEINSPSNISEKSSISSKEKSKYKKRKAVVLLDKDLKSDKESNKLNEVRKYKKGDKKVIINTDVTESEVTNGKEEHIDNGIEKDIGNNIINRRAYVAIEINDVMMKSVKSPNKSADINDDKSEDDLPLSKIYPDFKPRVNEPGEITRDASTLPPKKKIKFVHFTELNGSSTKPAQSLSTSSPSKIVPKLKLVFSPTRPSVMSMPKIPKKSKLITNGSVSSTNSDAEIVEMKVQENVVVPEEETNANISSCPAPTASSSASSSSVCVVVSPSPPPPVTYVDSTKRCIRPSCTNIAIEDFRWDMEFCSPDCAIMYSKYVFNEWLNQRKEVPVLSE